MLRDCRNIPKENIYTLTFPFYLYLFEKKLLIPRNIGNILTSLNSFLIKFGSHFRKEQKIVHVIFYQGNHLYSEPFWHFSKKIFEKHFRLVFLCWKWNYKFKMTFVWEFKITIKSVFSNIPKLINFFVLNWSSLYFLFHFSSSLRWRDRKRDRERDR